MNDGDVELARTYLDQYRKAMRLDDGLRGRRPTSKYEQGRRQQDDNNARSLAAECSYWEFNLDDDDDD